ncbi:hypothetical protein NPIL_679881 [Nephila pilipes]|uniref:Uncharacterized protein n=1 Tax=Nephila pilipes TaxID=299642 RepID=A0A8X6NVI1_NEPPI|nr:hypothetical protein NPIL_642731 [Nephila pilipes]GFT93161.1 hypothetical protein NPIL_679881 [Nephila pilipes]
MTCLVNSDNERDSCLLNRLFRDVSRRDNLLRGTSGFEPHEKEQKQVSDALRCPGPHAQYNEGDSVCFFSLAERSGQPVETPSCWG